MASNPYGSAIAPAVASTVVSEDSAGGWMPKQRSVAVDSTLLGMPGPAAPTVMPPLLDPGETLRTRILNQVRQTRNAAADETTAREAAVRAKEAAAQKVRDDAARKKADETARQRAAAEAAALAEQDRLARLAVSYVKPVASYTLNGDFGGASSPWATGNAGQDFAVPTGTPAVAIHSGTITSAGWAGAFGYRIVLTLDDGTQLWYCHLSSMVRTGGRVGTGEVIGRVGATGNASAPLLHLEVRPAGTGPVDPMGWMRERGVAV